MKLLKTMVLMSLLTAGSLGAHAASLTAELPSAGSPPSLGTHIVIVGKGLEVGDQFLRAGHTQSLTFRDRPRHGRIVFVAAVENAQTVPTVQGWGYANIKVDGRTFTSARLLEILGTIPKIASIDFIGHNGAFLGFVLEDYSNRFFLKDVPGLAALRSRFTADAFIRVLGCNTAWKLAPAIARALQVPVGGTFTFADVQNLHENGEWFYHDVGRFPEGRFRTRNELSFFSPISCVRDGGCARLKTVNSPYTGRHGNYGGGLPILKYFCADLPKEECARRMALSMQYQTGLRAMDHRLELSAFAENLSELFCPSWKDGAKRRDCRDRVEGHILGQSRLPRTFSTFAGKPLVCDMRQCQFKEECANGKCVFVVTSTAPSTTVTDELDMYLLGRRILTGQ